MTVEIDDPSQNNSATDHPENDVVYFLPVHTNTATFVFVFCCFFQLRYDTWDFPTVTTECDTWDLAFVCSVMRHRDQLSMYGTRLHG